MNRLGDTQLIVNPDDEDFFLPFSLWFICLQWNYWTTIFLHAWTLYHDSWKIKKMILGFIIKESKIAQIDTMNYIICIFRKCLDLQFFSYGSSSYLYKMFIVQDLWSFLFTFIFFTSKLHGSVEVSLILSVMKNVWCNNVCDVHELKTFEHNNLIVIILKKAIYRLAMTLENGYLSVFIKLLWQRLARHNIMVIRLESAI